jgi:hypothetical protein
MRVPIQYGGGISTYRKLLLPAGLLVLMGLMLAGSPDIAAFSASIGACGTPGAN